MLTITDVLEAFYIAGVFVFAEKAARLSDDVTREGLRIEMPVAMDVVKTVGVMLWPMFAVLMLFNDGDD
jgi:hypothetical protein